MILKDLDPFPATSDARLKAGRAAEEQMAFYLKREFGRSEAIFVFNSLRLENRDDIAQMDHLIIHKGGIVIVESKSVHGKIRVNEHGEWSRIYGSRAEGMPSPILQAKRQGDFLIHLLDDNAPLLAGKALGLLQQYFGMTSVDVVVAISDSGIIERPKNFNPTELCKADQAPELIRKRIEAQAKESHLLNFSTIFEKSRGRGLSKNEVEAICQFLPTRHKPLNTGPTKGTAIESKSEDSLPTVSPSAIPPVKSVPPEVNTPAITEAVCALCGKPVSEAVQKFCAENPERFGGAIYCYIHQKRRRAA